MYQSMDYYISGFTQQITDALQIAEQSVITPHSHNITNIVVSGLGGSGIGGNLTATLLDLKVPLIVNRSYKAPSFLGPNTLLIISSYSGNTEETVSVLEQSIGSGAKIVCVTSGGRVAELAAENGLDRIEIPGGMPPRTCLNLSFIQQVAILTKLGLCSTALLNELPEVVQFLGSEDAAIRPLAKQWALKLHGFVPWIYCDQRMEAVAIRFRQQLNENSKVLASHHVIPEMNHNELVGWRNEFTDLAVVFLRNENDNYRNAKRMDIVRDVASRYCDHVFTIDSKGKSEAQRLLYLIYLTDWISYELATLYGVDSVEVDVIDFLKAELKNL